MSMIVTEKPASRKAVASRMTRTSFGAKPSRSMQTLAEGAASPAIWGCARVAVVSGVVSIIVRYPPILRFLPFFLVQRRTQSQQKQASSVQAEAGKLNGPALKTSLGKDQ